MVERIECESLKSFLQVLEELSKKHNIDFHWGKYSFNYLETVFEEDGYLFTITPDVDALTITIKKEKRGDKSMERKKLRHMIRVFLAEYIDDIPVLIEKLKEKNITYTILERRTSTYKKPVFKKGKIVIGYHNNGWKTIEIDYYELLFNWIIKENQGRW